MGRNNADFHGAHYEYANTQGLHYLEAQVGGEKVGSFNWEEGTGKVTGVYVTPEYRRQKIGTGLFNEALRLSKTSEGIPTPKITSDRSDDGEAWATSLKVRLPKRKN